MELNLRLTKQEVEYILSLLGNASYTTVKPIVEKIVDQSTIQLKRIAAEAKENGEVEVVDEDGVVNPNQ